jgi:L-iditol 2-dehydrogenase
MKSIVLNGKKGVEIADVPMPTVPDNYSLVRIMSAPMCTEYRLYHKGEKCTNLGHEAAGEVVATSATSNLKSGDRVIVMPQYPCGQCSLCQSGDYIHCEHTVDPLSETQQHSGTGTFAEYIIKPDWLLLPIPEDISYDEASMACCGLGPALQAVATLDVSAGESVLITGLGPIGLGAVICCTAKGARVIGVSRNNYRSTLAAELGAEYTIDAGTTDTAERIFELTNKSGVDKAIECSGVEDHIQLAIKCVKRKGRVAFIGESPALSINLSNDLLRKGLSLYGIWHWNLNYYKQMIDTIRSSKDKIHKLVTHTFPLDQVEQAFKLQLTAQCGKIILKP